MPAIDVRPAIATDIPFLMGIDHSFTTEFVWQMDLTVDQSQFEVKFRKTRLPRSVHHGYPRNPEALADDWTQRSGFLVALHEGNPVGYICMMLGIVPQTTLTTDLVVKRKLRRKGIGTSLVLAGQEWALHHNCAQLWLEMQSKNYPAIRLAQKLGYDFCGYSDRYYPNQDIALFFSKPLN